MAVLGVVALDLDYSFTYNIWMPDTRQYADRSIGLLLSVSVL
jgi:hypothetical protein